MRRKIIGPGFVARTNKGKTQRNIVCRDPCLAVSQPSVRSRRTSDFTAEATLYPIPAPNLPRRSKALLFRYA